MSFTVELPIDELTVDAGSTASLNFKVRNDGSETVSFEVQIEGIDAEWTATPVPVVTIDPGREQSEKIFFKPPRASESVAGAYPFVLNVRNLTSGESKVVQGVLQIKPFHYLSMELTPKKGMWSPTKKENQFEATLLNLGNSDVSLQLFGNDPEDALSYQFEQEQIAIGPGQTRTVEATVAPLQSKWLSSSRLHGFSIGARGLEAPSVVCSAQAQLEQRAMFSPGAMALGVFLLLLFFGWLALLPKPPELSFMRVSAGHVFRGDRFVVRWQAANADRVQVRLGGELLVDSPELVGSEEVLATKSGTIEAYAVRDGRKSASKTASIEVTERPVIPAPEIESFSMTPRTANKGDKITVRYSVGDSVTKLTLSPPGQQLDTKIDTIFISADVVGEIVYKLVAENSEGKTTSKAITITVVDPTLPRIDEFSVSPALIEADSGLATVHWRTTNATRFELFAAGDRSEPTEASGSRDIVVSKTSEFIFTVWDAQGRKTTKKARIEVKPPVKPIDPSQDPASTTGGAGGAEKPPTTTGGTGR